MGPAPKPAVSRPSRILGSQPTALVHDAALVNQGKTRVFAFLKARHRVVKARS
jgi:hypothetical protein